MKLANILTLSRIVLAPIILILLFMHFWIVSSILIIIAFATDILDGYVARKLKQKTKVGAVLDAVADKLLVFSIIFSLLWIYGTVKTNWLYGIMFFSRDILNFIFLIFSKKLRKSKKHPRMLGKMVTLFQAIAIFWIILRMPHSEFWIYVVFILGIMASVDYFTAFRKSLKKHR